jgi:hypothetical protein
LKLLASIVLTAVILVLAILAYSQIYDSPVVHDGPFYPNIASSQMLLPIDSNPFPSENCSDITSRSLLAAESLSACTEAAQCREVWNANLDSVRVINKANMVAFNELANEVAAYCGERVYSPLLLRAEKNEYKTEIYCENLKCGSRWILIETWQEKLYRESLSIVQEINSIEAQ